MAISGLPGLVPDPRLLRCARNDRILQGPGTQPCHRGEHNQPCHREEYSQNCHREERSDVAISGLPGRGPIRDCFAALSMTM
jgi:hypothetical protein